MEKRIHVEYFALLSQEAGKKEEELITCASTLKELFSELKNRYKFSLSDKQIKIAVNDQIISSWDLSVSDGDHLLFLTPLAGG